MTVLHEKKKKEEDTKMFHAIVNPITGKYLTAIMSSGKKGVRCKNQILFNLLPKTNHLLCGACWHCLMALAIQKILDVRT